MSYIQFQLVQDLPTYIPVKNGLKNNFLPNKYLFNKKLVINLINNIQQNTIFHFITEFIFVLQKEFNYLKGSSLPIPIDFERSM